MGPMGVQTPPHTAFGPPHGYMHNQGIQGMYAMQLSAANQMGHYGGMQGPQNLNPQMQPPLYSSSSSSIVGVFLSDKIEKTRNISADAFYRLSSEWSNGSTIRASAIRNRFDGADARRFNQQRPIPEHQSASTSNASIPCVPPRATDNAHGAEQFDAPETGSISGRILRRFGIGSIGRKSCEFLSDHEENNAGYNSRSALRHCIRCLSDLLLSHLD